MCDVEEKFKKYMDEEEIKKRAWSLFTCGKCMKEDKEHIEKVINGEYANMLCGGCKAEYDDAINSIARKYLTTNPTLKKMQSQQSEASLFDLGKK